MHNSSIQTPTSAILSLPSPASQLVWTWCFSISVRYNSPTDFKSFSDKLLEFYSYNVEAALTFFWAVALTQSIFQLEPVKSTRKRVNYFEKATAILLPAILMGILRLEAVQKQTVPFLVLADGISKSPYPVVHQLHLTLCPVGFCLSGSGVLLIVILVKYIHTRRNLLSWNVRYGQRSNSTKSSDTLVFDSGSETRRRSIYDRWLVVRFSIAFVALA